MLVSTADNHVKTVSVKGRTISSVEEMTMSDIVTYVRENVSGMENASVTEIWEGDDDEDYEDDNDIEGNMKISGDSQLNGTLKDSTGAARIFSNWEKTGNDITRDSNVTITGDLQLNGTLKDSTGATEFLVIGRFTVMEMIYIDQVCRNWNGEPSSQIRCCWKCCF